MALRAAFPECPHCQQFALAPDGESYGARGRKCWTCGYRQYGSRAPVQLGFEDLAERRSNREDTCAPVSG